MFLKGNHKMDNKELLNEQEAGIDLFEQAKIRREKLAELKAEGNDPYAITSYKRDAYTSDIIDNFEEMENKTVSLAGRIMTWRDMGKASFVDLHDTKGKIQIYIKIDLVGEENYKQFGKWDIGDIIGVEGVVFRTRRGEISIQAKEIKLLSKSLLPLPDKWHGLKDMDMRYRQRYLDLITSPEVKDTFIKRSAVIKELRRFLDDRGYLEVETPVLNSIAGGATARPFNTHHNALDIPMYLRIALELHLKRLIVGGLDKVYEIGRVFRNEGISIRHNPEFTMLELYEAFIDYNSIMEMTEEMFRAVSHKIHGTGKISYNGTELDFDSPFKRITMLDSIKEASGVDFANITTLEEAVAVAKEHHIEVEKHHNRGNVMELFFEKYVEPNIVDPTFVMGHPVEISPFAKKDPSNPTVTERFELFIMGREYANAFSELNDPIDQRERFEAQLEQKNKGDQEAGEIDEDFINALEYAMPPTGGLGVGVDRLVMLMTDSYSIRDVLLFPTMKPIHD